jgi:2-polyprenyl-6-methoxyphenol hydroxylase-like FAD-dependent oxidoreductase
MTPGRALVIGGSIGGLLTANLLRTDGWEVTVFERASGDLSDRGAGIGTRDALFAVLRRAGLWIDASIGVEVRSRLGVDRAGTVIHEVPFNSISSAWARIYHPLRTALPAHCYHPGAQLVRIEQSSAAVTAFFADGSRAQGDLLIGADGLHSTVRRQFLPDVEPRYAGYVSWRVIADQRTVPVGLHPIIFDHMLFYFPDEGLLLSTPVPGPDRDSTRRCQIVWFRPVTEEALPLLCTDAEGRQHGLSIPPPLIRPTLVSELKASAQARLPAPIAEVIAQAGPPLLHLIFDLESPKLVFGRVALLGDAAFVARPHVATGITKAALDAQALVDALATESNIEGATSRYERDRQAFGQWLVARGRHIGERLATPPPPSEDADRSRRRHMEIVMREYGAAGVVADEPISSREFVRSAYL